jgi:AcrR family transcriptional regulator
MVPNPKPPTPRLPRTEVRSRLLAAAGRVFAQKGFAAASVDDVARAAGMTKGAIYSNFASKDDLFLALLAEHVAGRLLAVHDLRLSRADGGRRIGDALMKAAVDDRDWELLFIEFWQRAMRDPGAREQFVTQRRELRQSIAAAIERQADELDYPLPVEPKDLATIVLALSNGLAIEHLADPDDVPARLFGDVLAALLEPGG